MALDHAKLKAVFEKALPPITDSGSLALRCCLLQLGLRPSLKSTTICFTTPEHEQFAAAPQHQPCRLSCPSTSWQLALNYPVANAPELRVALAAACKRKDCAFSVDVLMRMQKAAAGGLGERRVGEPGGADSRAAGGAAEGVRGQHQGAARRRAAP